MTRPNRSPHGVELLESRIAPATLFVGKASNFTVTNDTGTFGLSPGDTVTFIPDADTNSAHITAAGLIFGTRAFIDLPSAITAAVSDDTIRVATGTFNGPITVGKSLTFLGNQAGHDARTGRTTVASETILNLTSSALVVNTESTFDGFQFNTGSTVSQGARSSSGSDQWVNNIFVGGFGIELRTVGSGATFVHNRLEVTGTAVSVPTQLSNTTIEENKISDAAIAIDFQPTSGTNRNNVIARNEILGSGAGIGLQLGAALPSTTGLLARENFYQNLATGVRILGDIPTTINIRSNFITATTAIDYLGTSPISAPFNFYGASKDTAAEIDLIVNGPVDFEPFALTIAGSDSLADRDSSRLTGFQPRLELGFTFAGKNFTYTDPDGDLVTVAVSKGDLSTDYSINLDAGNVGTGLVLGRLSMSLAITNGTDVIVSVARGQAGDGFADVGLIATNTDLGKVVVRGDLAALIAGDATPETPAVKSLLAQSMGRGFFTPQASTINGTLLSMKILGDFSANLSFTGSAGAVKSLFIGGSMEGLSGVANSGRLILSQGIATGTILGSLRASDAAGTAALDMAGSLGTLTIGGALSGGTSASSALLHVGGSAKTIIIKGGILASRGELNVDGSLDVLTVGGDLLGLTFIDGSSKKVAIAGSLGGPGSLGLLSINGSAGTVTIGGSIKGGELQIEGSAASVSVRGDVDGSTGSIFDGSLIVNGNVGKLAIGGSVRGGSGFDAGFVAVSGKAGAVSIGGNIIGDTGFDSGSLKLFGDVTSLVVGGNVIGGSRSNTGQIEVSGKVKTVVVRGGVFGGTESSTGTAEFTGGVGSLSIGGSVVGGSQSLAGSVTVRKAVSINIAGSIIGGNSLFAGSVFVLEGADTLRIGGDVIANGNGARALELPGRYGSVMIGGDVVGDGRNTTITFDGIQAPADQASSVAVKSLSIRGSVTDARIEFGTSAGNPDVSAGTIAIGGDFRRSSIALGINDGNDALFGTADDTLFNSGGNPGILALLAKLTVGGAISGDPHNVSDFHGILAQGIASIIVGGKALALTPGADDFLFGASQDVRIREFA